MPNTKSAKKRLQQDIGRRARNRAVKSAIRTQVKRMLAAVEAGDAAKSQVELKAVVKRLDQASAKGVVHKNTAARTKSRLTQRVKAIDQKAS